MAGSMSFTYDDGYDRKGRPGSIRKVLISWTSDASGNADGTTEKIVGTIIKAITDPGDGPTDNYDITITDSEGVDVFGKCKTGLMNRDTTNSEEQYFLVLNEDTSPLSMAVHPVVCDVLTVTVAAAGNAKSGQLILFYKP